MILEDMITLKKFSLVKVMITQIIYQIIPVLKNIIKLIAIDLSKQQKLDPKTKTISNTTS